ncbi:hypothetical protein [Halanaerobacter jeridensis]|uniref:Uncharacterized protein n=1 Tax=Halanaerobacter jeridensis TaxID=706427 RepID=A0A939BP67_9FIRM|nr:hypothetical protein [Halanaerobacter jeridensis]MBM7556612.1 hypothetical protein [Halanaerobacter jeridensis]
MRKNKVGLKELDCYVSGDIKQTQNCDIDVQQPNNNVVASQDVNTHQNDRKNENSKTDEIDNINNQKSEEQIIQQANSQQSTEQPENNVWEVTGATINQNNNLDKTCKRKE